MRTKELLPKKETDLIKLLSELDIKLAKLKIDVATKKSTKHHEIKQLGRDVARIKTILRERELMTEAKSLKQSREPEAKNA